MVALTAVTPEGRRFPVFGRVGTSLASALAGCSYPAISSYVAVLSPRHGEEAHVRVAHEFLPRLAPLDEDGRDRLEEVADDVRDDSRLASTVRATWLRAAWAWGGREQEGTAAGRATLDAGHGRGIRGGSARCKGCGGTRRARLVQAPARATRRMRARCDQQSAAARLRCARTRLRHPARHHTTHSAFVPLGKRSENVLIPPRVPLSQVTLTPEMNSMVVALAPLHPFQTM
jgi:hypothetical protein